jgi:hypothetical protein
MALGARCTMKSESLSAFCDLSRHGKWLFWLAAFSACSDISLCPLPHGHRALRTARARESECCDMAYYGTTGYGFTRIAARCPLPLPLPGNLARSRCRTRRGAAQVRDWRAVARDAAGV